MKNALFILTVLYLTASVGFCSTFHVYENEQSFGLDSPSGLVILSWAPDAGDMWTISNGTDHPIYVSINGGPWVQIPPGGSHGFEVPCELIIDWANGTGTTTIVFDGEGGVTITNNRNKPQVGGASYGGKVKKGQLPQGSSMTIPYKGLDGFGLLD